MQKTTTVLAYLKLSSTWCIKIYLHLVHNVGVHLDKVENTLQMCCERAVGNRDYSRDLDQDYSRDSDRDYSRDQHSL